LESRQGIFWYSLTLSADGKTLAAGAFRYGDVTNYYVLVYKLIKDQDEWKQLGQDLTGFSNADQFGCTISLSANGRTRVLL